MTAFLIITGLLFLLLASVAVRNPFPFEDDIGAPNVVPWPNVIFFYGLALWAIYLLVMGWAG